MNAKENLKAFYLRQRHDEMPSVGAGEIGIYPVNGFWERPPYNGGGKDWFGSVWEFMEEAGAPAPDCRTHVMDDICKWESQVIFPDLDAWDWEKAIELDKIKEIDRENSLVNVVILSGLWERLHILMGFENALCSLLEEPKAVGEFFDAMTDYKIKLIEKIADYYQPDVITFHDDWGSQTAPFFSPSVWRELIKPRQKRIVAATHNLNIIFEQHSCGKYDEIIPDIAEIGVDVLQCMDIMDIGAAIEKTDDRMAYVVSVHTQEFASLETAGKLSEDTARNMIHNDYMNWGKTGFYMPFTRNSSPIWYDKLSVEEYIICKNELKK